MSRHEEPTALPQASDESAAITACRVIITAGASDDVGRTYTLTAGSALVGRAPTCDIHVSDADVSRRHTMLTLDSSGVIVRDLESRHGTFYLGSRIERAHVPIGASIKLGKTTIALLPLEESRELPPETSRYDDLVGVSLESRRLFATLKQLEGKDVNVCLVGEAGTGKELIARTIHRKSVRSSGPFVAVDCAIAEDALLLELAGRMGRGGGAFEQADGGTLYLEHAHALPGSVQARLKTLVERGEMRRLDDTIRRRVKTRIILSAETPPALEEEVRNNVAVLTIDIAPLRQRRDDIPLLADAIAEQTKNARALTEAEKNLLRGQPWPGNVRELRAAVARMVTVGMEAPILQPVAVSDSADASFKDARERVLTDFEVEYLRTLMKLHDGNVSAAARDAQLSRKHLHELLRRHGIK